MPEKEVAIPAMREHHDLVPDRDRDRVPGQRSSLTRE
jgi:hypothetical protein